MAYLAGLFSFDSFGEQKNSNRKSDNAGGHDFCRKKVRKIIKKGVDFGGRMLQ